MWPSVRIYPPPTATRLALGWSQVTFRYRDAKTEAMERRTVPGAPISERLNHNNARSAWHVGDAFRPGTDDGSEADSRCAAHAKYSLTETTCSAENDHMTG